MKSQKYPILKKREKEEKGAKENMKEIENK